MRSWCRAEGAAETVRQLRLAVVHGGVRAQPLPERVGMYRRLSRLFEEVALAKADGTYTRLLAKISHVGR